MRPWCIHTFYQATCPDCRAVLTWQAVITGNVYLLKLPGLGRIILLDSAWDWVLHVR